MDRINTGRQRLRVPFGERDGVLHPPDSVPSGLACGCVCPGCGGPLISRHSRNQRPHFAHHNATSCDTGYETAVHRMAKQIIADSQELVLPAHRIRLTELVSDDEHIEKTIHFPTKKVTLQDVMEEASVGRFRPDLVGTLPSGVRIHIEILVTHSVEAEKAAELDNLMEINLSDVEPEVVADLTAFTDLVISGAFRNWYRTSLYNSDIELLEAAKDLKRRATDLARKKRQLEAQQRNREAERERQLQQQLIQAKAFEEQHRAAREPHMKALHDAVRMTYPSEQMKMTRLLFEHSTQEIEAIRQRYSKAMGGDLEPFGSNLEISGDWIVKAHRIVWQTAILEEFLLPGEPGDRFAVSEVSSFIQNRFGVMRWMSTLSEMRERGHTLWFANEDENRAIIDLRTVIAQYLDRLSLQPYWFVSIESGGEHCRIIKNDPIMAYAEHRLFKKEQQLRNEMRIEAEELRRSNAKLEWERQWGEADGWAAIRSEELKSLFEGGAREVYLCGYCFFPHAEKETFGCKLCESRGFDRTSLDESFVQSFKSRISAQYRQQRRTQQR